MSLIQYNLTRERINKCLMDKFRKDGLFPDKVIENITIRGIDKAHPDFYVVEFEFSEVLK